MRTCCAGLLLAAWLLLPGLAQADGPAAGLRPVPAAELAGEYHRYALDFLIFTRLAAGELSFRATEQPDVFEAELVGRTLGVAAWLTGDRTQRYLARMRLMPEGRLRSLVYESRISKRKRGERHNTGKRYSFDYARGKVTMERTREGRFSAAESFALPRDVEPVDILTAFYNLRAGVYGEIRPGVKLSIPTFDKKGVNMISVDVLTAVERIPYAFFPDDGTLLRVHVDPEVFGTGSGDLLLWFSPEGTPAMGIVQDMIGLGDVRGYQEVSIP